MHIFVILEGTLALQVYCVPAGTWTQDKQPFSRRPYLLCCRTGSQRCLLHLATSCCCTSLSLIWATTGCWHMPVDYGKITTLPSSRYWIVSQNTLNDNLISSKQLTQWVKRVRHWGLKSAALQLYKPCRLKCMLLAGWYSLQYCFDPLNVENVSNSVNKLAELQTFSFDFTFFSFIWISESSMTEIQSVKMHLLYISQTPMAFTQDNLCYLRNDQDTTNLDINDKVIWPKRFSWLMGKQSKLRSLSSTIESNKM